MTPGAPSPGGYNPHTPGSGIEQNSSDWVTTDIQVKVRDTYLDTQVVGQTGVIRSVTVSGTQVCRWAVILPSLWLLLFLLLLFNCLTRSSITIYNWKERCIKVWHVSSTRLGFACHAHSWDYSCLKQ